MAIHNLMEDLVLKTVDEVCLEEMEGCGSECCKSPNCLMDVACFVLNRIPQHYVTSGRGMAHAEKSIHENSQLKVDIVTLVHEGFNRVSNVKRSYYKNGPSEEIPAGPHFNFPTFKARLLNCLSFKPISNVAVSLLLDGSPVEMLDGRWQNPFVLDEKLDGTLLFLPRPLKAETGEKRTFEFEISAEDPAYEPFHHFFKLELTADAETDQGSRKYTDYKLPNLFLIPK